MRFVVFIVLVLVMGCAPGSESFDAGMDLGSDLVSDETGPEDVVGDPDMVVQDTPNRFGMRVSRDGAEPSSLLSLDSTSSLTGPYIQGLEDGGRFVFYWSLTFVGWDPTTRFKTHLYYRLAELREGDVPLHSVQWICHNNGHTSSCQSYWPPHPSSPSAAMTGSVRIERVDSDRVVGSFGAAGTEMCAAAGGSTFERSFQVVGGWFDVAYEPLPIREEYVP